MKLALSNIAWTESEDSFIYKIMLKHGFSGLEIAPTRLFPSSPYTTPIEQCHALREYIQSIGFKIVSMQSLLYKRADLKLFADSDGRNALREYLQLAIDFASSLGITNLVFGSPRNRVINDFHSEYDMAVKFFRELAEYAANRNSVIAMEPNPSDYGTNFINTTAEAATIVKAVDHEGFRLQIDSGTLLMNHEDLTAVADNVALVNHVHISEPYLAPISEDNFLLHQQLCEILRDGGYQNWVSIEMKRQDGDNYDNIDRCCGYVSKIFGND